MTNLIVTVLLLNFLLSQFIPERVQCVAVAAGGKAFPQEFYCEAPDCAARVKSVFCNDKQLLSGDRIQECAGPPPPDSVCQHQGRAFVSTVSGATCEFEGTDSYIKTKKCTDLDSTCVLTTDTSPQKPQGRVHVVSIVCGLIAFSQGLNVRLAGNEVW